jgi:hypothetical protein
MLTDTALPPAQRDLLLRLEKPLAWLCQTLDAAVQQTRVGDGPRRQVDVTLPFAPA